MQREKTSITFEVAFKKYYGGVEAMRGKTLPYVCIVCGEDSYPKTVERDGVKDKVFTAVMSMEDCFRHIRKIHKEKIHAK